MREHADELLELLESCPEWPPEEGKWNEISRWAAFREANADALKPKDWRADDGSERPYLVDPLAGRIAGVFADLIFGIDPVFTAAAEGDQNILNEIVAANDLPSELQFAERLCASEGEVWWRIYVDREVSRYPVIQWVSRAFVIPLFRGRTLLAAAFVSELATDDERLEWRHVEIQAQGGVLNRLYCAESSDKGIGRMRPLEEHPETEAFPDEWTHELDAILCGRMINDYGVDSTCGVSQFAGAKDLLLALNEATTIGVENARLTAKKRVVVPQRFLDRNGNFPAGAEIIIATEVDQDPDKPGQGLAQVEWEFDAAALNAWTDALEERALTRCRVAPQLVGRHTEGAQSGPALRARLLDTVLAADGKAREWDDKLPTLLRAAQLVDSLPVERSGLGGSWSNADEPPSVERSSSLPEDETEQAQRIGALVGQLLASRQTAIEELHPDWSEDRVTEELRRIDRESALPEMEV